MRVVAAAALLVCLAAPAARADEADPLALEITRMVMPPSAYDQLLANVDGQLEQNMGKMLGAMAPKGAFEPEEFAAVYVDNLRKLMRAVMPSYDELVEVQARLLAKHYTRDELKALRKFYQGPLGKKTIEVMPAVTNDAMAWTYSRMADKMPGAMADSARRWSPRSRSSRRSTPSRARSARRHWKLAAS